MSNNPLAELGRQWRDAKAAETAANKSRIAIENKIVELTGCKEEGSQTHDAGDFRITVTGRLNRTLDRALWNEIEPTIPRDLRPVEYVPRIDAKGLRYLEQNAPDIYRSIAPALTVKPGKPSICIKE